MCPENCGSICSVISLFFISGFILCHANYSSLPKREKWLCVTWLKLECNHSNRMWCRAVHLCICVQERGSSALGVVGLTHTCMRVVQWEAALLTQPCMVESERNLDLVCCFLSSATCVSVTVGFVPPQSLTHVDYLYLRQKANTSYILWASNQALKLNISLALWAESAKDLLPV